MKVFNNFESAFKWVENVVKEADTKALEPIAKEVYKDSKDYTYLDTEKMYNSGADSDFKGGYVVIKAPQVRRLYYGNYNGRRNKNAVPQWFEATRIENIGNYKKTYIEVFNKAKE